MQQVNYSLDTMQIEHATAALDLMTNVPMNMLQSSHSVGHSQHHLARPRGSSQAPERQQPSTDGSQQGGSLFEAYAAQFGLNKPPQPLQINQSVGVNDTATNSVEAYAALMGIKLDGGNSATISDSEQNAKIAQAQAHAANLEAMLKANGHSVGTSMTLPAGVGCGLSTPNGLNTMNSLKSTPSVAFRMDPNMSSHGKPGIPRQSSHQGYGKYSLSAGLVGSQTLAPEVLQSMIQHNIQNSRHSSLSPWALDIDMNDAKDKGYDTSKADKSRERNRDHSRKSRLRKKVYVEGLKQEVKQLEVYRQICEQCLDLLAIISTDASATFTFASCAYNRVLGIDSQELVANRRSLFDYVYPDDLDHLKNDFKRVSAFGELSGIKFRMKSLDGTYYPTDTTARVTDKGIVCVTRVDKMAGPPVASAPTSSTSSS